MIQVPVFVEIHVGSDEKAGYPWMTQALEEEQHGIDPVGNVK
jgi:hypothetical protein